MLSAAVVIGALRVLKRRMRKLLVVEIQIGKLYGIRTENYYPSPIESPIDGVLALISGSAYWSNLGKSISKSISS